jgi:hypothetical protein
MWITERAEVYPVVLKLDYKPRRVDYRALREGRTIELMNFFHFDGAEMTLRHLTLFGVSDPSIHPYILFRPNFLTGCWMAEIFRHAQ